jgi:hypothetical protein
VEAVSHLDDTEPLTLAAIDLTEKYGYDDGDLGYAHVENWADRHWPSQLTDGHDGTHPVHWYASPRALLGAAIRDHLLPEITLPAGTRIAVRATHHNPYRLLNSDGSDEHSPEVRAALNRQPRIHLEQDAIDQLCNQTYPARPIGWLTLYQALTTEYCIEWPEPADTFHNLRTYRIGVVVDTYAALMHDDALKLAGQMIVAGRGTDDAGIHNSTAELEIAAVWDALRGAHSLVHPDTSCTPLPTFANVLLTARPGALPAKAPAPPPVRAAGKQASSRPRVTPARKTRPSAAHDREPK